MKNKTFTVSKAQLDAHTVVTLTTYIDINDTSPSGATEARRYYPKKVNFLNTSGIEVKANIFSSDDEIAKYTADPTNYDFFSIPTGTSLILTASNILPTAYKILVQAPAGVATTGMSIECIGYQPRM
jgi:hypothetical protein